MSQIKNKFLAQAPTHTLKGNNSGSTANIADLTVSQVNSMLGLTTSTWTTYTPTITGFGTVSSAKGTYKQIGDSLFVKIYFVTGTVASSLATFTLPSGFTLSTDTTNKIPLSNTSSQSGIIVGRYVANISDTNLTNSWDGPVITAPATSTAVVYLGKTITSVGSSLIPANGNATAESSVSMSLSFEVILT